MGSFHFLCLEALWTTFTFCPSRYGQLSLSVPRDMDNFTFCASRRYGQLSLSVPRGAMDNFHFLRLALWTAFTFLASSQGSYPTFLFQPSFTLRLKRVLINRISECPPTNIESMLTFQYLSCYIFIFATPYNDVKSAIETPARVESLVKKFSAQRAICLIIFSVLFTYDESQTNSDQIILTRERAALILGAILFTGHISLAYDGLNEKQFKDYGDHFAVDAYIRNIHNIKLFSVNYCNSCQFFALGIASFVAAGVMGNMERGLMPVTVVTTDIYH
ncbi:hypothetical protein BDQ17DRAFT_1428664 [Cyathus striatus]|nr:hypothetical protein BDQ17DRAFT_1428664 [Cyathus striatus]